MDRLGAEPKMLMEGENRPVSAGQFWRNHQQASRYHEVVFDPDMPPGHNGLVWNLWRGFSVEPKAGDWSLFRTFIREVIANGDETLFQWLINWMAWLVQNPAKLIGTAPVLLGPPGIGKTFFAETYGRLWAPHFLTLTHRSHVTGRFNAPLVGIRVAFIDEGMFGGDREGAGVIKTRMTSEFIMLEPKGVDPIPTVNRLAWMVASNDRDAVAADAGDRRWMVMDVSDSRKEDHEYFAAIAHQMENGGLSAMLHDLEHHDLKRGPNPKKVIKSDSLFEQIIRAAPPLTRYLHSLLEAGCLPGSDPADPAEITIAALKAGLNASGLDRHPTSDAVLGKRLPVIFPTVSSRSGGKYFDRRTNETVRSRAYRFPALTQARKEFAAFIGMPVQWPDGPDNWLAVERFAPPF
jgi:hypothetical protein